MGGGDQALAKWDSKAIGRTLVSGRLCFRGTRFFTPSIINFELVESSLENIDIVFVPAPWWRRFSSASCVFMSRKVLKELSGNAK